VRGPLGVGLGCLLPLYPRNKKSFLAEPISNTLHPLDGWTAKAKELKDLARLQNCLPGRKDLGQPCNTAPALGIFKGVLCKKTNISRLQLTPSMQKVGPSTWLGWTAKANKDWCHALWCLQQHRRLISMSLVHKYVWFTLPQPRKPCALPLPPAWPHTFLSESMLATRLQPISGRTNLDELNKEVGRELGFDSACCPGEQIQLANPRACLSHTLWCFGVE
jgi:hypothetical protein